MSAPDGPQPAAGVTQPLAVSSQPFPSPKQRSKSDRAAYHYYAGFSLEFAKAFLCQHMSGWVTVLDPWNGSGTTTRAAAELSIPALGEDLNPAMIVVAKGRLAREGEDQSSLEAALTAIDQHTSKATTTEVVDPLENWFTAETSYRLRASTQAITGELGAVHVDAISPAQAKALTRVFRIVRDQMVLRSGSNPTWFKNRFEDKIDLPVPLLQRLLREQSRHGEPDLGTSAEKVHLKLNDSTVELRQPADELPNLVLTSPPYCTRIDYGVATRPELSVLGISIPGQARLRRSLLGTTTVESAQDMTSKEIGIEATKTLDRVAVHPSRASATYYYKWLAQYFIGYAVSLTRLSERLATDATIGLVVQNSYYKDEYIDLSKITCDLLEGLGWVTREITSFGGNRSMHALHPGSKTYSRPSRVAENLITFSRGTRL